MISEKGTIGESVEESGRAHLRWCSGICMEELKKTVMISRRIINETSPEYK
jgi:hypothetical protein